MTSSENKNDMPGERMSREDFEKVVTEALKSLPKVFKDKLENVDVVIEDMPTAEEAASVGCRRTQLFGLYQGVPLSERTHQYGMVLPDKISIFSANLERAYKTKKEIKRAIRHTVQHELAHHFGIDDERLEDLGIY